MMRSEAEIRRAINHFAEAADSQSPPDYIRDALNLAVRDALTWVLGEPCMMDDAMRRCDQVDREREAAERLLRQ